MNNFISFKQSFANKFSILSLALGFSTFFVTQTIGQIIYLEIISVIAFILQKIPASRKTTGGFRFTNADMKFFFFLGFVWFTDQLFSNFIHDTNTTNQFLSLAQIFVFLILIYWGTSWFQINPARIYFFTIGYALSCLPTYFLVGNSISFDNAWKFLFGPNLTLLMFLVISDSKLTLFPKFAIPVFLSAVDLTFGSRSLALITLITTLTLIEPKRVRRNFFIYVTSLALIFLSIFLIEDTYRTLAISGQLGLNQQIKAQNQFSSGPILLVARSEFLYEISALKINWLTGYGAKPKITFEVLDKTSQYESLLGVKHNATAAYQVYSTTGALPRHSMILSAWVEGGVLALLFWLYLTWQMIRWSMITNSKNQPFGLLARYLIINSVWAILFSPLGAGSRVSMAYSIAVIYFQYTMNRLVDSREVPNA